MSRDITVLLDLLGLSVSTAIFYDVSRGCTSGDPGRGIRLGRDANLAVTYTAT
jgi:hypothetical protein